MKSRTKRVPTKKELYIVIALGGSIVAPDGINVLFLKKFSALIRLHARSGKKFILVVGGGKISRTYQQAASKIKPISKEDKDWIGVHSTRLNAHLLRTIFAKEAYPVIFDNPQKSLSRKGPRSLIIASGWKPGWSTDYIAVLLAKRFKAKHVIIAGSPSYVYTKDHMRFWNAKPIPRLTWATYAKLIPRRWSPGMKSPVDPVAAKLAQKQGIKAYIIKGTDLGNFEKVLEGKSFRGSIIS